MKRWLQALAGFASVLLTAVGILCVAVRLPAGAGQTTATAAAGFILPAGNTDGFFSEDEIDDTIPSHPSASSRTQSGPAAQNSSPSSPAQSTASSGSCASSSAAPVQTGKVLELSVGNSGTQVGNMWVKNSTDHHTSLNFAQELLKLPAVKIVKNSLAAGADLPHAYDGSVRLLGTLHRPHEKCLRSGRQDRRTASGGGHRRAARQDLPRLPGLRRFLRPFLCNHAERPEAVPGHSGHARHPPRRHAPRRRHHAENNLGRRRAKRRRSS